MRWLEKWCSPPAKVISMTSLRTYSTLFPKLCVLILLVASGAAPLGAIEAAAAPARIIIVRHGEKQNLLSLCGVGRQGAEALAAQYLGPTASRSLLNGARPAAILAITLHTLETAQPIAAAWNMSVAANPLMLTPFHPEVLLNARTAAVSRDLLDNPRWRGQTVVMVWEHLHIASARLEEAFPGQRVTLRQLLHLDQMSGAARRVPGTWPDDTYDYFWILDYDSPTLTVPSRFSLVRQVFRPPFEDLPSNGWGRPEPRSTKFGCL